MDRACTFTVADLAEDEAVRLPCLSRVMIYRRDALIALAGADARLHLIGLRHELWCSSCGEPPLQGSLVSVRDGRR